MARQSNDTADPVVDVEIAQAGVGLVTLRGEHDVTSKPRLAEALARAGEQVNVVIDLTHCSFMDSSVIAAFFEAGRALAQVGARLEVVIPPGPGEVRRIAEVTGLATILPVRESLAEAIAGFGPQEHVIQIRDLRARFGDDETRAAECSCGWSGPAHMGHQTAAREARREGMVHVERQRAAQP